MLLCPPVPQKIRNIEKNTIVQDDIGFLCRG